MMLWRRATRVEKIDFLDLITYLTDRGKKRRGKQSKSLPAGLLDGREDYWPGQKQAAEQMSE
jgi:hypothetical protein